MTIVTICEPLADPELHYFIEVALVDAYDKQKLVVGSREVKANIDDGFVDLLVLSNRWDIRHSQLVLARYAKERGVPFIYVDHLVIAAKLSHVDNVDATFNAIAVVADWEYKIDNISRILEWVREL